MADSSDITLGTILEHMHGMEKRLRDEFRAGLAGVQMGLERVERKVDLAFAQTENLDERLDDIEVVQIPAIKKWVGMK